MSYKNIVFEHLEDGIAIVTVNRPEKLNALNRDTMDELETAFLYVQNEPTARALIVTGAGEKAFVAGADIKELEDMEAAEAAKLSTRGQTIFRRLETMKKPSLAAINGFALGAGLELAMACTLRVAVATAKLGLPELTLGLIPGYGGTQRLARLVGRGRALELLLTSDRIDAERASRIGLVNRIVPAESLLDSARDLLRAILANGPVAIGLALEVVDAGLNVGLEEGLRFESEAFGLAASTEDRREGTRAFLERRLPVFTGR
jgi:enoyl-CoA hydratase